MRRASIASAGIAGLFAESAKVPARQRAISIDGPWSSDDPADAINAAISDGWRVASITAIGALSSINYQPITGRLLVLLERA